MTLEIKVTNKKQRKLRAVVNNTGSGNALSGFAFVLQEWSETESLYLEERTKTPTRPSCLRKRHQEIRVRLRRKHIFTGTYLLEKTSDSTGDRLSFFSRHHSMRDLSTAYKDGSKTGETERMRMINLHKCIQNTMLIQKNILHKMNC